MSSLKKMMEDYRALQSQSAKANYKIPITITMSMGDLAAIAGGLAMLHKLTDDEYFNELEHKFVCVCHTAMENRDETTDS